MTMKKINAKYEGRMFGPELEFFVVDRKFRPLNIMDRIRKSPFFGKGIKPELPNEQIEITCGPSDKLRDIEERLDGLLSHAISLVHAGGGMLLPASILDIGPDAFTVCKNPRYHMLIEALGPKMREHAPEVTSDQVNVGAHDEGEAFLIYNRLRKMLPYIVGFSAASPYAMSRKFSGRGHYCTRMLAYDAAVSRFPQLAGYPPEMHSLAEYGDALAGLPVFPGEPNMYYKYARPMPHRGVAAEIRAIDKQPSLSDFMAVLALCKGAVEFGGCQGFVADDYIKTVNIDPITACFGDYPEDDFEKAVERGIYDEGKFGHFLEACESSLPRNERHYLRPMHERLEQGTVAQVILDKMGAGASLHDIYSSLVEALESNQPYV